MIHHVTDGGDIARAPTQAIVNPVNCVGVMGAGLAKHLARAFPDVEDDYKWACQEGWLHPGQPHLIDLRGDQMPYMMVLFPTKDHWRNPSKLEWITEGLQSLVVMCVDHQIPSIAIPALGCGLGGLSWPVVRYAIEDAFEGYDIEVWLYHPQEGR